MSRPTVHVLNRLPQAPGVENFQMSAPWLVYQTEPLTLDSENIVGYDATLTPSSRVVRPGMGVCFRVKVPNGG